MKWHLLVLLIVWVFWGLVAMCSCATPFKIIDDKTYQIELKHPDEKVIIVTPNGRQAVGYIEAEME